MQLNVALVDRPVFQFIGHLHRVETKVDGSGRIHLDIDKDAFLVLQEIQRAQIEKGCPLAIAAVPLYPGEEFPEILVSEKEFDIPEGVTIDCAFPNTTPHDIDLGDPTHD